MDYNKIGDFIENERKAKKLTQSKLAKKLFVSEKTISKWENGNGIPDTNTLPKLCEVFNITINELLNGERVSTENYTKTAEAKLIELQKTNEETTKRLLNLEVVLASTSCASFLVFLALALYSILSLKLFVLPIILIATGFAVFFVGILFCIYIEQKAGYYECGKCKHKYIPTFNQSLWAPHMGRKKYLKCPHCKQRSWSKKVVK